MLELFMVVPAHDSSEAAMPAHFLPDSEPAQFHEPTESSPEPTPVREPTESTQKTCEAAAVSAHSPSALPVG